MDRDPSDDAPAGPAPPAARPPLAAYANHFEIGFNAFEFLLDFGQDYEGPAAGTLPHLRVVTAPAYAKAFANLLWRSIGDYEAAFGGIEPLWQADDDS